MVTQISFMNLQVLLAHRAVMGPTSYCLGPMVCSSSDVSRLMGNEIRPYNYSNKMLPWSQISFVNLQELAAKRTLQDRCCVQAQ